MFAQLLINNLSDNKKNTFYLKVSYHLFIFLRKYYLKMNKNALVRYSLNGHSIVLPLRHDLPIIKNTFEYYDSAIGRIPKLLIQKYSDFQAIDVGANIGDTAIVIKSEVDIPVLCIEGDEYYFKLLIDNTKSFKNIYCEKCFVGKSTESNMQSVSYRGSARLIKSSDQSKQFEFKSLSQIIKSYPGFDKIKFIKIDTDGFDCKIIRSNFDFIEGHKPVIYFEYDPYFLNLNDDDGLSVFNSLKIAGYNKLMIYDNTGRFILSTNVNEIKLLEELHLYYSGRSGGMYIDICSFHQCDNDIAEEIIKSELKLSQSTLKNISVDIPD